MDAPLLVAIVWALFGAAHLGLAALPVRGRLVARLGERGFVFFFSAVAIILFTALITTYAAVRFEGAAGPALGRFAPLRAVLVALVVIGVVLMAGTFATYDRSPYAALGRSFPGPRGLERITRHPFFAGLVLFSIAHALLATRLVGSVFLAGNAVVAALGMWHQDRKLAARYGAAFAEHLRATSAVPFAAIIAGRQRLVWTELPWRVIATGLVLAVVLRAVHDRIFAYGGFAFLGVTVAALAAILFVGIRRERSSRRPPVGEHAAEPLYSPACASPRGTSIR